MKKIWIGIIIIAAVALAIVLIVSQTKKEPEVIKIGAILPLTGEFSSHGEDAKKGIEIAIQEINSKNGIKGRKISFIYEDDKMQPAIGVSAFEKLTTINKVPVVLGGIGSSVALSIAPVAEKKKVVFISPTASNPKLTYAGDYIFRIWSSDIYESSVMADFVYDKLKIKKVAILFINNDFGQGIKEIFEKEFKSKGGEILIQESYDQKTSDFRVQLAKIRRQNLEAIYLPGYYQDVAKILLQIKEMGLKDLILLSTTPIENPTLIQIARDATEGLIYTRPKFNPSDPSAEYRSFARSFKERYGIDPGIAAAYSYDAAKVILHSIERTIDKKLHLTGENIQRMMANIKYFDGVTGRFSFDEYGDVIREFSLWTVKEGKFVPFE